MIGKSFTGSDFKKTVTYALDKEASSLLFKQNLGASDDLGRIVGSMKMCAAQSIAKEPVYHLIVSWDPADHVGHDSMTVVAQRLLKRLGLEEHQAVVAAHADREHPHIHIVANRVHPQHGRPGHDGENIHVWSCWQDRVIYQKELRQIEREYGWRQTEGTLSLQIGHEVPGRAGNINKEYHAREQAGLPPIQRGRSRMEAGKRLHRQWSSGAVPEYLPQTARQLFGVWNAADKGDAECQWKMGKMYAIGIGVPHDMEIATGWMQLAALQGHTNAKEDFQRYSKEGARAVNPPSFGGRNRDGIVLGLRHGKRPRNWIGEWIQNEISTQEIGR
ncbi:MAG: relaxase/mobilization nuclease domain-containing protein [Rhodothermaceae bacterium]|nr:relaxase/mobilization nuclease domain-containing protein [Rhodothermaceae bacterium]MYD66827.1 relaxase/mobilization nuclease domain-containing protein [Rhodothermaceae bacterium]MYJ08408.1 relaxase/mobilization nuclease domain-containing protein [Rhodothermaceae bacterium]